MIREAIIFGNHRLHQNQKSKTKTKSRLPHRIALSKYRCCEICDHMSVDDMEYFLNIVGIGCNERILCNSDIQQFMTLLDITIYRK